MAAFGFGVGDFLAGAELAYKLGKALSDSRGSSQSYRELMAELNVIHKVLLQVDQLRAADQLAKPTINALLFTVNAANESMKTFIEQNDRYHDCLKSGGSGNVIKDAFYKGKWATQMPEKTRDLRMSLASTLAAINTLVSLACYQNRQNRKANDDYVVHLELSITSLEPFYDKRWGNVKLHGYVSNIGSHRIHDPDFIFPQDPKSFFRPGQIFSTPITSTFVVSTLWDAWTPQLVKEGSHAVIGNSPLGPVNIVGSASHQKDPEGMRERLRQIRNLPLAQMVHYCLDTISAGKVVCLLCENGTARADIFTREDWSAFHFRAVHWNYYLSIIPSSISKILDNRKTLLLVPRDEIQKLPANPKFSPTDWIQLADVTSDLPILTDRYIVDTIAFASSKARSKFSQKLAPTPGLFPSREKLEMRRCPRTARLEGPVLIRRFLVVREGTDECLCLGIHTYAGKASADQSDQHLFAIVHPGKSAPQPLSTESGIILSPIRMKPDHPSTVLPQSARVHFGRAYQVSHQIRAQALGLVHPTSMECLEMQFVSNVEQVDEHDEVMDSVEDESSQEESSIPPVVDEGIVQGIRAHVNDVLGSKFSPAYHPPPESTRRDERTMKKETEGSDDQKSSSIAQDRIPTYLQLG